ncbi:MAG TPA: D-sedoheptulose 7-phosphate isomerase [Candidatus Omnitrophota bacterium]|nr:D-sedoheptulose 7-phosphate isomerase [Candidatus Omnitrophota bacterium]
MKNHFASLIQGHQEAFDKTFVPAQIEVLHKITHAIVNVLKSGNKILICGNGGSASDSQHVAAEFIGRFSTERISLPAIALTADTAALTAIGNDYGFDKVFSRQIEGLGKKGDVLITISTSGRSPNILEAIGQAKQQGILTIGFTGKDGGILKDAVDLCFIAKANKTTHVQEMHITALHAICEAVENILFE